MRWRKKKSCAYFDCQTQVGDDEFLCAGHQQAWLDGYIDRCPKCGRFKDVAHRLCQDCYFGRKVKPFQETVEPPTRQRPRRVVFSDVWEDGYMRPDNYFVYILELEDGGFYVGYTRSLQQALSGYRQQKDSLPDGRTPTLQYVQSIATEKLAELRVEELKGLLRANPEQLRLMMLDFRARMRDLGGEDYL